MMKIINFFRRVLNIREARVIFIKTDHFYKPKHVKQEILHVASISTFGKGWVEYSWIEHNPDWSINTGGVVLVSTYREYERFVKNIEENKILKLYDDTRIIP